MTNDDTPYGFVPWGPVMQIQYKSVATASGANPCFIGDVVAALATGYVSTSDIAGVTYICGVNLSFLTGGGGGSISIASDPEQFFHVQGDDVGGTLTIAGEGLNADHKYTAGSVFGKISKVELNTQLALAAAGATAGFRIHGLRRNINTDGTENAYGLYSKLVVSPNEHMLKQTTGV